MKTNSWITADQTKDISSSPNPLVKVLRRGRHWIWGPNRRRAIKEWSKAFPSQFLQVHCLQIAIGEIVLSQGFDLKTYALSFFHNEKLKSGTKMKKKKKKKKNTT